MSKVILPSAYFPPIPWMAAGLQGVKPLIEIHDHYIKQTIRNRCTIITANGLMNLVIPVVQFRNHTPLNDIRIDYSTQWQRVHEHALRSAYGKAAFFEFYSDKILALYKWQPVYLAEWNQGCLSAVMTCLKIDYPFRNSGEYTEVTDESDLRSNDFPVKKEAEPLYTQVFMERHGFYSGLSILDMLFCCGPETKELLMRSV